MLQAKHVLEGKFVVVVLPVSMYPCHKTLKSTVPKIAASIIP